MKPFLSGKKSVELPPPAPGETRRPISAWACKPEKSEPNVEVVKQGDKVVRIVFTCSCGERTEVECLYPAG
jgi:hypothetical protein